MPSQPPATCQTLVGGDREASQAGPGGDMDDPNLQVQGMDPSQHSTGSYWDAGGQCWDWELCNHATSLQSPWDRVPGLVRTQPSMGFGTCSNKSCLDHASNPVSLCFLLR